MKNNNIWNPNTEIDSIIWHIVFFSVGACNGINFDNITVSLFMLVIFFLNIIIKDVLCPTIPNNTYIIIVSVNTKLIGVIPLVQGNCSQKSYMCCVDNIYIAVFFLYFYHMPMFNCQICIYRKFVELFLYI